MTTVYYTSDLHFGHRLCARLRGFGDDVDAHDQALIENWRRVVKPEDIVWVLGDLAMNNPEHALEILFDLPGHKHLIPGNHDEVHPMHRNSHKWQRRYLGVFSSIQPFARRTINGEKVLLSHFPYSKDRHEARFIQWRLRDEGAWLIHGHTHQAEQRREGREIHVGVDAWDFTPVSDRTIADLMRD